MLANMFAIMPPIYTSGRHGAKLAFVWGHVSGYLTNVSNVVWAQTSGALAAMLITMYNKVDLPELVFFFVTKFFIPRRCRETISKTRVNKK